MTFYAGIDFGTSNCTAGWLDPEGAAQLCQLEPDSQYLSSALYVERSYDPEEERPAPSLASLLNQQAPVTLGQAAHRRYSQDPHGGVFIRSPKSMLGSRLTAEQTAIYQRLCGLLLGRIRQALPEQTNHVVIGRPIHFQGIDGRVGDDRAEAILRQAAQQVGFQHIEFAFEPVAAALEYEQQLRQEQCVLVVDIGGGTTDLSMVRLGPERRQHADRQQDMLAHAGRRIGGVDMDIKLALYQCMPLLGRGSKANTGRPLPNALFSDAVNIINVQAQEQFYQASTYQAILELIEQAEQPELVVRFLQLYQRRLSYHVVLAAEQAKVALSQQASVALDLKAFAPALSLTVDHAQFEQAIYQELQGIRRLITQVVSDAGVMPQQIFITGGASGISALQQLLTELLPGIPQIRGDRFGSVGRGLCRIAHQYFGSFA